LPKAPPPDDLGFPSQAQALSVSETPGFAAELFEDNPILLLKELDHRLLMSVHRVASVSLRSAKKPHPGGISWVPCGRARETDEERKLPSQPQPAAAMAC
jgi:hypothetical protein